MKLLLTSAGVKNAAIREALVDLLGKPITESSALCIPTAMYGHPGVGPDRAWAFASGHSAEPMVDLGWKSVGLLELTALPGLPAEQWTPWVREADVLLASGGDALFLAHWVRESGLLDVLPTLDRTVWLGMSAGSMVMAPAVGRDFIQWRSGEIEDRALGLVDFAICPHLADSGMPGNTIEEAVSWARTMPCPTYAIDDQTAIRVVDGHVDVVSEGRWERFPESGGGHAASAATAGTADRDPSLVPVPGGALAVDRTSGSGAAVVLLHSGISDRRGFTAMVDFLQESRRVIAYDRRGHGDSTATGEAPDVDDLLAVLDGSQVDRAWLVGSSAGGQVALEAAVLHPDRVAGLVLLAPVISGAPETTDDGEPVARLERLMEQAGDDIDEHIRLDAWLWLDGPSGPEGRVAGPARAVLAEMDRTTIEHGRSEYSGTTIPDLWDRLPEIACPTCFVVGDLDLPSIVEQSTAAAARVPHARLLVLPGRAHLPYLEDADECARLVHDLTQSS